MRQTKAHRILKILGVAPLSSLTDIRDDHLDLLQL